MNYEPNGTSVTNTPTPPKQPEDVRGGSLRETFRFALLAILIVIPVRLFVMQPFIVNGSSMDPSFATGQYLIVDELSYRFSEPERGDVVIIRYPRDPSKFFIKRIVGLPGDTVEIRDGNVVIENDMRPEGFELDEPYVKYPKQETLSRKVENDEYFVMGDNRAASSDSRYWGTVPRNHIVGRALIRLLPVAQAKVLPGEYRALER